MKKIIFTGLLTVICWHEAVAQKDRSAGAQRLNINLGDVIDISFVANDLNVGPQLQMSFITAKDYFKGIETEQQMLQVASNKNFTVSVRAVSVTANNTNSQLPSFIYIKIPQNNTGGNIAKAFSNNVYQQLKGYDMVMLEDAHKGDNQTFSVQYKAQPGTMVDPGIYAIEVIFTASRS